MPAAVVAASAPLREAAPAQSMLHTASYVRPAPNRLGDMQGGAPLPVPALQKASLEVIKAPPPARLLPSGFDLPPSTKKGADKKAADKPKHKPEAEPVKLALGDPLPKSLLPADIGALAAREAHGSKAAR